MQGKFLNPNREAPQSGLQSAVWLLRGPGQCSEPRFRVQGLGLDSPLLLPFSLLSLGAPHEK